MPLVAVCDAGPMYRNTDIARKFRSSVSPRGILEAAHRQVVGRYCCSGRAHSLKLWMLELHLPLSSNDSCDRQQHMLGRCQQRFASPGIVSTAVITLRAVSQLIFSQDSVPKARHIAMWPALKIHNDIV